MRVWGPQPPLLNQHRNRVLLTEFRNLLQLIYSYFSSTNHSVTVLTTSAAILRIVEVDQAQEPSVRCGLRIFRRVVPIRKHMTGVYADSESWRVERLHKVQEFVFLL